MARTRSLAGDSLHTLLSDSRRRHVLALLMNDETKTVDELVRQIAASEADERPEAVSEGARRRVAISLVHKHLPLLEDHNVVQHDHDTREVTLLDVFDEIEPYFGERTALPRPGRFGSSRPPAR